MGKSKRKREELEFGLNKGYMDSIANYIYFSYTGVVPDAFTIYNDWAADCDFKTDNPETLAAFLEYIRKISLLERKDLRSAIID